MALHTRENQFSGVNPHLHSHFQAEGGWASFHTNFIAALARHLNVILPDGFLVDIEQSLQIREIHPDTGERIRRPEPDLTIYRTTAAESPTGESAAVATVRRTIPETISITEDLYYQAVLVYRVDDDPLGTAVTRIEVLSPTNKRGDGAIQYREKRYAALKSGVALVEIDLLHETPAVIAGLPRYPVDKDSYPYTITVSNPVPSFEAGMVDIYGFGVDVPIPQVAVPLAHNAHIDVNFDTVYQEVFTSLAAYSRRVDYAQPPPNFDTYSRPDQSKIREHMVAVLEKHPEQK